MISREAVATALATFVRAPPELVARRQLLRRIDAKYLIEAAQASELIASLAGAYAVLPVAGGGIATYRNLYFDSPELRCFHDHRRGRRIRHKVRIRHYPDRELSYLEIKTKRSERITDKQRCALPYGSEVLGDGERAFLRDHAGALADELAPTIRIDYRRIALIGLDHDERLTIDLEIEVVHEGQRRSLGELAIIEIKRPPAGHVRTPAKRALEQLAARERSFSKYCAAIALARPDVRWNRLRPSLRAVAGLR